MNKLSRILLCLGLCSLSVYAAQKRSRAEGLPELSASNTVGLGDIWVTVGMSSYFKTQIVHNEFLASLVDSVYRKDFAQLQGDGRQMRRELLMAPDLHGIIGLTNFLHLEIENTPWDGEKIGATTAHLKITTPGNDNLRVFGLAISLNATLSTEESAQLRGESTPGFDPQMSLTAIADADLIKWIPSFPMKLYFNYSNLDEVRLAHDYEQHAFLFAWEYKGENTGMYLKLGTYLYRSLPGRVDTNSKSEYLPLFYDFGFGYRQTLLEKFSCVTGLSFDLLSPFAFYSNDRHKSPKLFARIEVPLWQQETRAEAIRSLIFHEQKRKTTLANPKVSGFSNTPTDSSAAPKALSNVPLNEILGSDKVQDIKEKGMMQDIFEDEASQLLEKRKQIRGELKQIEEQLE